MDSDFWEVFYTTFAQLFDIWINYELHFPEPIGTITPFQFTVFFFIAEMLAMTVNNIASRKGGDIDDE